MRLSEVIENLIVIHNRLREREKNPYLASDANAAEFGHCADGLSLIINDLKFEGKVDRCD